MPAGLLSYDSVATMLDVSTRTVRRLVERKLLAAPRKLRGLGWRFRVEDVYRFLAVAEEEPSTPKSGGQDRTGRDKSAD